MGMTKVQAVAQWRKYIFAEFSPEQRQDRGLVAESWGVFIDGLCKDGQITERQYHEWLPPVECRTPSQISQKARG